MIVGSLTLSDVDEIYQRMGVKELVVYPWYEDGVVAGLITGVIDTIPPFIGKSAMLEHFIVLPEAKNKLRVMQQLPTQIAPHLVARGVHRILCCIAQDDPRRFRLGKWGVRTGFQKFGEKDGLDWYIKPLTPQGMEHEKHAEASHASSGPAAASAASPGS